MAVIRGFYLRRRGSNAPLAVLAALGLLGASCGCAPAPADPTAASVLEQPRSGGVLRVTLEEPTSLDPILADSVYESIPVNQIFDSLVALDPSLHVTPALAATWTISEDGRLYRFRLREGVRFHDGRPLTAGDVEFSFRRVLAPNAERRCLAFPYLDVIAGADAFSSGALPDLPGVRAVGTHTVEIRLERPYLSFLEVLAMDGVKIVPAALLQEIGEREFGRAPVGSGPFAFHRWGERHIELVANPHYFAGRPFLDGLEFWFNPEVDSLAQNLERLEAGEVDVVDLQGNSIPSGGLSAESRVQRYQELSLSFIGLSNHLPPLDDARVRQAIAHAIDRERLTAQAPGERRHAVGILPPGLWGYSPTEKTLPYDPVRARALLAEAGYPGGDGLPPIELVFSAASQASRLLSRSIVEDLEAVGVEARPVPSNWVELNRRILDGNAPLFLLAWIADLTDPDAFVRSLFEIDGDHNYFRYRDEVTEDLLEKGSRELNPDLRAEIYRSLERRILQAAPMIPLYHTVGGLAQDRDIHGLEPGPLGVAMVPFERVWIARRGNSP